jgi:hypothetical protein
MWRSRNGEGGRISKHETRGEARQHWDLTLVGHFFALAFPSAHLQIARGPFFVVALFSHHLAY